MSDLLSDDETDAPQRRIVDIARLRFELRTYYLLFFALLVVFLAVTLLMVWLAKPVYTATALVGPADNSDQPFGSELGGLGGSGVGGIAKHLHVGGMLGQGGADPFDEYTSLLNSTRLASVLVGKDHLLPEIFDSQWDAANKRWYPRDSQFDRAWDYGKTLLRRPVKSAPDEDDLLTFFATRLIVDQSLETGFATVTFKFGSPAEAERILNLILLEADNIIRQDKRRDVAARIAYLNEALEHITLADQKPAMIEVLSQQEQEMMMVASDHRYASVMIDPPHAPLKPTSPLPTVDAAIALGLSCVAWLGAVRLTPKSGRWRRLLDKFARPGRKRRTRLASAVAAKTAARI
ncbi:MAG TPA: Wzz/FepE/Etk N-terminal domain-containing protein [Rhizomicrobium sp.]